MAKTKKGNLFWYVVLTIIADFAVIIDSGFFGYSMAHDTLASERFAFWIILIVAGVCKYSAERLK